MWICRLELLCRLGEQYLQWSQHTLNSENADKELNLSDFLRSFCKLQLPSARNKDYMIKASQAHVTKIKFKIPNNKSWIEIVSHPQKRYCWRGVPNMKHTEPSLQDDKDGRSTIWTIWHRIGNKLKLYTDSCQTLEDEKKMEQPRPRLSLGQAISCHSQL